MMSEKTTKSKWLLPFKTFGIKKERTYFLENLAMLTSSGMGIFQALDSIKSDLETKRMNRAVEHMRTAVEGGSMLWEAMDDTNLFPDHVVSLVRIGEKVGRLSQNIQVVAEQEKKESVFRSKLYSAMMYPIFVLLLALIIGVGIAWFILPNLASVFSSLQMDLPLITQWLIATGSFLGEYGIYVVPLFLLLIFTGLFFVFLFPPTKHIGKSILFHVPGTKKIIQQIELSRLGYLLGSLLKANVVITDALKSMKRATKFPAYQKFYSRLESDISDGSSFKEVIDSYDDIDRIIPSPIQGMIISAENSGNLPETLESIGSRFEEKLETSTKNLTVMLEPLLLFIVWIAVVSVALAVILPIYSLVGDLNAGGTPATGSATEQTTKQSSTATTAPTADRSGATTTTQSTTTSTTTNQPDQRLEVMETPTGYLNVRSGPSTATEQIGRVNPGDVYSYIVTDNDWYQIELDPDTETYGWVYGDYVTVIPSPENEE